MAVKGAAAAKTPPVGCWLLPRTAAPEQTKSQDLQPGAAGPGGPTGREKCAGKQIAARPLSVDFGHNVEQHRHERWSDGHLSYIHLFTRTPQPPFGFIVRLPPRGHRSRAELRQPVRSEVQAPTPRGQQWALRGATARTRCRPDPSLVPATPLPMDSRTAIRFDLCSRGRGGNSIDLGPHRRSPSVRLAASSSSRLPRSP